MNTPKTIIKTYKGRRGKIKDTVFNIIIDESGEILFNTYKWYIAKSNKSIYLKRNNNGRTIYFHREIMNATNKDEIDHINRNTLDNRLTNLRFVTRQQNNMNKSMLTNNTSGHRGVTWNKEKKKWRAQITINMKWKYLGKYSSFKDACIAYEKAAQIYFGEYLGEVANI